MSLPEIVSRQQWLAARKRRLAREKELMRQHDALNADRRRLPVVAIGKARDTTYVRVSRAPYPTLAAAKAAHGWTFPSFT